MQGKATLRVCFRLWRTFQLPITPVGQVCGCRILQGSLSLQSTTFDGIQSACHEFLLALNFLGIPHQTDCTGSQDGRAS